MAKKKGGFTKHAGRVGNRLGGRAKNFVNLARAGQYDATQLAKDVSGSLLDAADFWSGLFGSNASPATALVDLGPAPAATWKLPGGVTTTVVIEDPVPDDAKFPIGGLGNPPLLKLAPVGGAVVNLDLIAVTVQDDDGLELRVTIRDTGGPALPPGEYFGTLYYASASLAGSFYVAVIRATLT